MTIYEHRQSSLGLLRKQPDLGVSEGAIWNDPNTPEQQGLPMGIHGGTLLKQQDRFQNNSPIKRYQQVAAAKFAFKYEAAAFVKEDASIPLEASITTCSFAKASSQ